MTLRQHLVDTRIAGDVATPRDNNLRAMRRLADGDAASWFGLAPRPVTFEEVLDVMAARCGVVADPAYVEGPDRIDPDLTLDRLDAAAERLARAARDRADVFLATGHPAGLLAIHLEVAAALREAGCAVLTPSAGSWSELADTRRELRYLGGVGVVSWRGELNHTHSAVPMRALLDGGMRPGLVCADHGWAGAAAEAGVETVSFADSNDPALFLGEADGRVAVTVPLDDNVLPHHYAPLAEVLTGAIRAAAR
ncbi:MAG TPA: phosphatase [Mycobacteriales bacterium]|nr:phosphatase [Mycobacteriales bacterium]